jgi:hypothetical protein
MSAKYSEIEEKIVNGFMGLLQYMSPRDAVLTIDYKVFTEHADEFYQLTEEEQMEVRRVILALKLVHV